GKGRDIVVRVCQQCHGLEQVVSSRRSPEDWKSLVNEMISNGAPLTDDEAKVVAEYLAKSFPEGSSPDAKKDEKPASAAKVNVNSVSAEELEKELQLSEKDAKAIVKYRADHGKFTKLDDLKKVPDVDAAKLESVKERLEF